MKTVKMVLAATLMVIIALGLAACDRGTPAGGRGYFDPPPPMPCSTRATIIISNERARPHNMEATVKITNDTM